jgi:hypothetical protein
VLIIASALVLGRWIFYFILKGNAILDFSKNILSPLEHILNVTWERTDEALKLMSSDYQYAETWYYRQ